MKISIYQINPERDSKRICFTNLRDLKNYFGIEQIKSGLYDKVFEGVVDCENLDQVYAMFNIDPPYGYSGHCLSVSDVIHVQEAKNEKTGFFFVDSFGFKPIEFDIEKTEISPYFSTTERTNGKLAMLLIEPCKVPKSIEISKEDDKSLHEMQKLVGGYIETLYPFDDDDEVAIICNDEGKINGLPLNRAIRDKSGEIIEIIAGNFLIAYAPAASGSFRALPKQLIKKYTEKFKKPERFIMLNGKIMAVPLKQTAYRKDSGGARWL